MTETRHKQENKKKKKIRGSDIFYYLFAGLTALTAVGFVMMIGLFLSYSVTHVEDKTYDSLSAGVQAMLQNVSRWFDGIFFQYNLLLLSIAVAIPPLITLFYVMAMRDEKKRRLHLEMPADVYNDERYDIEQRIDKIFNLRHYLGSMPMLTLLVLMGGMIILLLKPLPLDSINQLGVDYSKGANFLMLGPNMDFYVNGQTKEYMSSLTGTLSAFQFGFLGAYVYFITHLVRSYFTLDLTPNTFVASSIRMMMGSLLALVCAFLFLQDYRSVIPILSFCIGFFPQRGLLLIEKTTSAAFRTISGSMGFAGEKYAATHLSQLPGMSFAHEIRLQREGYDNIENFTHADAADLAVRTGFSYKQLVNWISRARLMQQLGPDYQDFMHATGLSSLADIEEFSRNWRQQCPDQEPHEILMTAMKPDARHKIQIICVLGDTESAGKS